MVFFMITKKIEAKKKVNTNSKYKRVINHEKEIINRGIVKTEIGKYYNIIYAQAE
jgi:hypothetical protein